MNEYREILVGIFTLAIGWYGNKLTAKKDTRSGEQVLIDKLFKDIERVDKDNEKIRQRLDALEKDNKRLSARNEELEDSNASLITENNQLKVENTSLRSELAAYR